MALRQYVMLLANYNAWMNRKLYAAAGRLGDETLYAERGAFFGSLFGTLNHLVVADTIWLQRFAMHPTRHTSLDTIRTQPRPTALDSRLHDTLPELADHRLWLDETIQRWASELTEADLAQPLEYANMKGVTARRPFDCLVLHFFNHQTHHRGQATTLLSQASEDVGVTDLLALIDDV
ncbi:MAG: DinB family protein [Pseudomonadota bacterium]|nr:DinB family protein [Pseudomonadota bacterium]